MIRQWRAPIIFCAVVTVALGVAFNVSSARADGEQVVKYGQTFTHVTGDTFTVTIDGTITALHVVGTPQAWICNHNNVGPGILPCVPGQTYTFTDTTTLAGAPCAYLQSDEGNVFDTVPGDPTKAVCFPASTPTATPTGNPTSTPQPSETSSLTPQSTSTAPDAPTSTSTPTSQSSSVPASVTAGPLTTPTPSATRLGTAPQIARATVQPPELARTGLSKGQMVALVSVAAFAVTLGTLLVLVPTFRRLVLRRYKRGAQ